MANRLSTSCCFRPVATALYLLVTLLATACSKEEKPASAAATPAAGSPPASTAASTPKVPVTQEDRIIAQARASVGPEDKLLALQTIKMTGSVLNEKNEGIGIIHLFYKKPGRQRSEFTPNTDTTIIECSNGLEGWRAQLVKGQGAKFSLMTPAVVAQGFYTALENLFFYRASELIRGSEISSEGPVEYRDTPCWKVSFHYPNSITYVRYFDNKTGELRGTILQPAGSEFVEEGKKNVNGINFPLTLKSYDKAGKLMQTVKFDTIEVNQPMNDNIFETPSLIALQAVADKAKAAGTGSTLAAPAPASSTSTTSKPPALKLPPLTAPAK